MLESVACKRSGKNTLTVNVWRAAVFIQSQSDGNQMSGVDLSRWVWMACQSGAEVG